MQAKYWKEYKERHTKIPAHGTDTLHYVMSVWGTN